VFSSCLASKWMAFPRRLKTLISG